MPLPVQFPNLKSGFANVMNLKQAGTPTSVSLGYTQTIAAALPTGLQPMGPVMVPVPPLGFPICKALIEASFNLGPAAKPTIIGNMMAGGIATLGPTVPPTGQVLLAQQIGIALNLQQAGKPDPHGALMAAAVLTYYASGTVI